jgi:hypothetical protein
MRSEEDGRRNCRFDRRFARARALPGGGGPTLTNIEKKMQACLKRLGIQLYVRWAPDPTKNKHGEISGYIILLYDENEAEAWQTFTHELLEYKFKGVCETYRSIINSLIETLEKLTYSRKEEFLEFVPKALEEMKRAHEETF